MKPWFQLLQTLATSLTAEQLERVIRMVAAITGVKNVEQLVRLAKLIQASSSDLLKRIEEFMTFSRSTTYGDVGSGGSLPPEQPVELECCCEILEELLLQEES